MTVDENWRCYMEPVKQWIFQIVFLTLAIVIFDIIIPEGKSKKFCIRSYSITALFYYSPLFTKQYTTLYSTYNPIKKRSCRFQLLFLFPSSIKIKSNSLYPLYPQHAPTILLAFFAYPALTGSKIPNSKFSESKEVRCGINCP